jgi:hypothetical protein
VTDIMMGNICTFTWFMYLLIYRDFITYTLLRETEGVFSACHKYCVRFVRGIPKLELHMRSNK